MGAGRSCGLAGDTFSQNVSLDQMLNECDTGDVILFNNPMAATYFIKVFTDSKWDHVGMILKYSNNPAETILIESAGCGVFICYARDRLKQVLDDSSPSIIGWRQLQPRKPLDAKWKKMMHREAERLIDTPYEQNFSEFIKAWAADSDMTKSVLSKMGGTLAEGATKGEDLNSLFCSELCAHMLKYGKLMDKEHERDSNGYSPKDFASQGNAHLDLRKPFGLQQEKRVLTNITSGEDSIGAADAATAGASPLGTDYAHANGAVATVGDLIKKSEVASSQNNYNMLQMALAKAEQSGNTAAAEGIKARIAGLDNAAAVGKA